MIKLKKEIIKFAQKLNETKLSPLRSGNLSIRVKLKNKIGRKVIFCLDSTDSGIVLYDKNTMYYEN